MSNIFAASDGLAQTEIPSASAETPEIAQARAAFAEGIELARQGRWIDALSTLERSNELRSHAVTTYNIGYCERSLGRYTRARKMLAKALFDHKASGDKELSIDLVTAAQGYLSEAERQIARVTVTITPKTATVKVDGRPLEVVTTDGPRPVVLAGTRDVGAGEVAPAPNFDVHIDPGTHEFVVSTKDQGDVATTQTFSPGSSVAIQLTGPAERVGKDASRSIDDGRATGNPNRTPVWIAFGVGAAGVVVGTIGGAIALSKKSDRESGLLAADISTAAFITAGVGVGVGVVLLLTTSSPGKKAASEGISTIPESRFVRAFVGPTSAGVEGRF